MADPNVSFENSRCVSPPINKSEEAMKKRKSPPKSPMSPLIMLDTSSSSSDSTPSDDERLTKNVDEGEPMELCPKATPSRLIMVGSASTSIYDEQRIRKGNPIQPDISSSSSSTITVKAQRLTHNTTSPWMMNIDIEALKETIRMSRERGIEKMQYHLKNPNRRNFEIPILEDDQHLDPTQYYQKRLKTLAAHKVRLANPYANKLRITRTMPIPEFIAQYGGLSAGTHTCRGWVSRQIYLAGRLTSKVYSSDVITYDLVGFGGQIQVEAFPRFYFGTKDYFLDIHSDLRVGDYVGVLGFPAKSSTGELSIRSLFITRLSYCLHKMPPMLPIMKEKCYRRCFQDLTLNSKGEVINETREKVASYIRHFLDNLGFLEADSPTLTMVPGGADARPFMTCYNDLNMKMFMEISPELYLKQFVGGGKERVYEIGKLFRNDGIDLIRCPEFMCEFYMVLADYKDLMQLTEQMLSGIVKELTGGYKVAYHANGYDNNSIEIDFTPPFRRIYMIEELNKIANLTIPTDLASPEASQYLSEVCNKFGITCPPPRTAAQLFGKLARHFLEHTCVNPTFIMDHPDIMCQRAKSHLDKSGLTERFQLFINTFELINAYTEEHDPMVQRQRFANQVKDQQSGDGETVALDETLCVALEYGLPPTAAWVMGIDRLTMLLTDSQNIKTGSYTFPTMKPQLHHEQPIKEDMVL